MRQPILLWTFALLPLTDVAGQERGKVQFDSVCVTRIEEDIAVSFKLVVSDIGTNDIWTVTPVLYNKAGSGTLKLKPVEFGSRRGEIMRQRELWSNRDTLSLKPTFYRKGETAAYHTSFPYEQWMDESDLRLDIIHKGCCQTKTENPLVLIKKPIKPLPVLEVKEKPAISLPEVKLPVLSVAETLAKEYPFLEKWKGGVADREEITMRRDGAVLVVYFAVGKNTIDREYRDNGQQLDKVIDILDKIADSGDSQVVKILVAGFSSPEGTAQFNERLAGIRATVLMDYVMAHTKLDKSYFSIYNGKEDWDRLRMMVAESDMKDKQAVLDIIDHTPIWDARKKTGRMSKLYRLNAGKTYRYLKEHFFPLLRNAGYIKVYYETKSTSHRD